MKRRNERIDDDKPREAGATFPNSSQRSLVEIAEAARSTIHHPTAAQRRLLRQLEHQAHRLGEQVFQLAVLGQFKRGKSSLLNALIGQPLLSAGVLPLTSVPTFLTAGTDLRIRLTSLSGGREERKVATIDELAKEIAAATTEEQNPRNEKRVRRVDVGLRESPWLEDVTLVDTPGIGSTQTYNTDAAYAVLPECDAALFVCSIDPPITEVELGYLSRICQTVPRVIVVLNKIDLVDEEDREKARAFLASIIAERPEAQIDRRIFPVSARQALAARRSGDDAALEASGLLELERHLRADLIERKRQILASSIANKMAVITHAFAADTAMMVSALSLPLSELDAKAAAFAQAAMDFERERVGLEDTFNGEWRRAAARLDGLCETVGERAQKQLDAVIISLGDKDIVENGRSIVGAAMTEIFDREFTALATTVESELAITVEGQQKRYRDLAARVGEAAGTLLDVPMPPAVPDDWVRIKRDFHWLSERRTENIGSLTMDGLARLLPAALRRRRQRKQFREAVANALMRNLSDLNWEMRQNIDDSFRGLLAAARAAVEISLSSTRELLGIVRERRRLEGVSMEQEIEAAKTAERRIAELDAELGRYREQFREGGSLALNAS
ncbi:dynamin family protein [Bosea sp. AS-1]|uniref:dynamin family protein n=1 Tax=Bosea sp. AS-1 TaxID=2015316 RepID=UPI0012FE094F|nr:dynamin family protein [Bosea sp. AS-1]